MVCKSFFIGMAAVIGAASVFMLSPGCSKDEENPADKVIGRWTGSTIRVRDTFALDLNIPDAANFTLMRSHITCSSSSCTADSLRETGTWAVSGDNVVLTYTLCLQKQSWKSTWVDADTLNCNSIPHTGTIPNTISNNQWTFSMVEWVNGDTISYTAAKNQR